MKKKWLIGLISALMAVTLCFGLAACGGDKGGEDDKATVKSVLDNLREQYNGAEKNTPVDYTVLSSVSISGTSHAIEWSVSAVTEGITIGDYVAVGETDATANAVTIQIKSTAQPIDYKLTATVKVNKESGSVSFDRSIPQIYTVAGIEEFGKDIASGSYYEVNGQKTAVLVTGYVVARGTYSASYKNYNDVYIADTADAAVEYPAAMQVYRLEVDGTVLKEDADLVVGAKVMVHGWLQNYSGKLQLTHDASSSSGKSGVNPTLLQNILPELTDQEKVTRAKDMLTLAKTLYAKAGEEVTLPDSIVGATITWAASGTGATVTGSTLKIASPLPTTQQEVTLTATITAGEVTDTKTFTIKIGLSRSTPSTQADPYTVAEANEFATTLDNQEYSSRIYVKGYVVKITSFSSNRWNDVYIADTAGETNTAKQLRVYRLVTNEVLEEEGDLAVGDQVILSGFLRNYNDTYELTYNNSEDDPNAYCVKLILPGETPEEKVQFALDRVSLPETIKFETELPASPYPDVELTYESSNTGALTIASDNSKMIPIRGAADVDVTVTVTAECEGVSDSVTKPVKVLQKVEIAEGKYTFGFKFSDANGNEITSGDRWVELLNASAVQGEEAKKGTPVTNLVGEVRDASKAFAGQGSGGAHENSDEILKLGTSSATGSITIFFENSITDIKIEAEGWPSSGSTTDKIAVNGVEKALTISKASYTYSFDPTSKVSITSNKRALIWTITVTVDTSGKTDQEKITESKGIIQANDSSSVYLETYDKMGVFTLPSSFADKNNAQLAWSLTSPDSIEGGDVTLDNNKLTIVKLPTATTQITLMCRITSGTEHEDVTVTSNLGAAPTLTNTGEDETHAFTVAEARAIAEKLESGTYWGVTTATQVYVKGYVLNIGTWNGSEFQNVYIVDNDHKSDDNNNAIMIYGLICGSDLKLSGDLSKGSEIVVYGFIEHYNNKFEVTTYQNTKVSTIKYVDSRSESEKQNAAIAAAKAVIGTEVDADVTEVTLPDSTVSGVTLTYSGTGVTGKTLTVEHTQSETTVELTITAAYAEASNVADTVTLTVAERDDSQANLTPKSLGDSLKGSYGNATGVTVKGVTFSWVEMMKGSNGIQWRTKNGNTSSIWNTSAFTKNVTKIVITYNSGKNSTANMGIKVEWSTDANFATESTKTQTKNWTASATTLEITPEETGSYTFVRLTYTGSGTQYFDSIKIY